MTLSCSSPENYQKFDYILSVIILKFKPIETDRTKNCIPVITLVGGELLSELPSTSPLVSEEEGGEGCSGFAVWDAMLLDVDFWDCCDSLRSNGRPEVPN